MIGLARRLAAVQPSASAGVSAMARELRGQGRDIIDLGMGEPDFATPPHVIEAAHAAAIAGQTKYPPTGGTTELKAAVVDKLRRDNELNYDLTEIIASNGAKQVIFNALMATLEPGDEVLLCTPYFDSYRGITSLLGGVPVPIRCAPENAFRLTPADLEAAITPRTKWLILNHPANPSGVTYSASQLQALGAVLGGRPHVLVLSDEIYEHIFFDDRTFTSFGAACPELRDRTLVVNGVSKAYAMTGWRIGYGAGNAELISAMTTVQSQATSGACSIAQAAATAALNGPQDVVTEFCNAFEQRRNLVIEGIAGISELSLVAPTGAFYAYLGCEALIGATVPEGALSDDVAVTKWLLNSAGVAAVPGAAYELSPYFRISTASADALLREAIDRISVAVAEL